MRYLIIIFIFLLPCVSFGEVMVKKCEGEGVGINRTQSRTESIWNALMKCAEEIGWKRDETAEEQFKSVINPPETFVLGFKELSVTFTDDRKYLTKIEAEIDINYFKDILVNKNLIKIKLLIPKLALELSGDGMCSAVEFEKIIDEVKIESTEKWRDLLRANGKDVDYLIKVNVKLDDKNLSGIKWCETNITTVVYRGGSELYSKEEREKIVPLYGENVNEIFSNELVECVEDAINFSLNHWLDKGGLKKLVVHVRPWHPVSVREEVRGFIFSSLPQVVSVFVSGVDSNEVVYSVFVDREDKDIMRRMVEVLMSKGWTVETLSETDVKVQMK